MYTWNLFHASSLLEDSLSHRNVEKAPLYRASTQDEENSVIEIHNGGGGTLSPSVYTELNISSRLTIIWQSQVQARVRNPKQIFSESYSGLFSETYFQEYVLY